MFLRFGLDKKVIIQYFKTCQQMKILKKMYIYNHHLKIN